MITSALSKHSRFQIYFKILGSPSHLQCPTFPLRNLCQIFQNAWHVSPQILHSPQVSCLLSNKRQMRGFTIKEKLETYFDRLWPLNRSILGPGFRDSLDILSEIMPTERLKFQTGSSVLDWRIPEEWKVNSAYIIRPDGKKIANFDENNLHLVGYSMPFRGELSLTKLKEHLHSIPQLPDAIPYVTSYYERRWGFCISDSELQSLPDGIYTVVVDTELYPGHLEIGEAVLPGQLDEEILFSTYLCHPSMANNELSGPLTMCFLYEAVKNIPNRRYTYRFVITAETIGTIAYLSLRGAHLKEKMIAGYQMTCLGDRGEFTYKKSRIGNSLADRVALAVLKDVENHKVVPFYISGSDERQYCSPGFNLSFGSLMRTPYDQYPEYHTSLDNKSFISFEALSGSIEMYTNLVQALENNLVWENLFPYGEPQLGRRGLFATLSSYTAFSSALDEQQEALFWVLNLADGINDILAIAEISGCRLQHIIEAARILYSSKLLSPHDKPLGISISERKLKN